MNDSHDSVSELLNAIKNNDRRALEEMLTRGMDINMTIDDAGNTPLTIAIQLRDALVRFMLTKFCEMKISKGQQHHKGFANDHVLDDSAPTENSIVKNLFHSLTLNHHKAFLDIVSILLQEKIHRFSTTEMQTILAEIAPKQELMLGFVRTVAQNVEPHHECIGIIALHFLVSNNKAGFWGLFEGGLDLEHFCSLNTDGEGNYEYASNFCRRTDFIIMLIQAANSSSAFEQIESLLNMGTPDWPTGNKPLGDFKV